MNLSKDEYEEISEILSSNEYDVEADDWKEEGLKSISCDEGSFILIFENDKINLSFDVSCQPDYVAITTATLFSHFSNPSSIQIMENFSYDEEKKEIVYGEEASQNYYNVIKQVCYSEIKHEDKIDCLMYHVDPIVKEC